MYQVLLVEDDKSSHLFSKNIKTWKTWEEMGFCITGEAENETEALKELEKHKYDMIVVDVVLPAIDGLQILKEIKKREIQVISVIVSTNKEFDYLLTGMRLGLKDYLVKPVEQQSLSDCLERVKNMLKKEDDLVEHIFPLMGVDMSSAFAQKVKMYFQANKKLNSQGIAEEFQLNKEYFAKKFKSNMGESFRHFLLKYKMEYAKVMLADYEYKIYEISEKLGYKGSDYFTKLFKKYVGVTPIQYRKNIHRNDA